MPDSPRAHWDAVYATRPADAVSWFQHDPAPSLAMIAAAGIVPSDPLIDVGGGASLLVDRLLDAGYGHVSVLDIAASGLALARARLGGRASRVAWLVEDATRWQPSAGAFRLWHDRAVFHFLVDAADRAGYRRALDRGLHPDGFVVLATFAPTGPERCSGLPVCRYSAGALAAELGSSYRLIETRPETHLTPSGRAQDFTWCLFRRLPGRAP
jgi:hypothetical protein